ncbi:site specific recombinase, phage integrase family protein [Ceratobasidium sp. AG-Ba]|nr:site specific recombinase, phage integrase family protein [Ceratobasidium sp. AG-Ba]
MATSTIANHLSGIRAWHEAVNAAWNDSPRLYQLIQGAKNLAPASSSAPARAPVTTHMLEALNRALDHSNDEDCAILAAAAIAFWCQCRLGELLGSSSRLFDPKCLPSRSALGSPISDLGSRPLCLPRTKTHQLHGESVVIMAQPSSINPVRALNRHLSQSRNLHPSSHLFAFRYPNSAGFKILTAERFLLRCNAIWTAQGFQRVSGHCFWIGGTTNYLKAGVPPEVVRTMGRWGSDAFYKYWRDHQEIALHHAEQIHTPCTNASRSRISVTDHGRRAMPIGPRRLGG